MPIPGVIASSVVITLGGGITVEVGSFTKIDTVTTQDITIGANLNAGTGAVILEWAGSNTTAGTWDPSIVAGRGLVGVQSGTVTQYSTGVFSEDNVGTTNTSRRMAAKAVTFPSADGSTVAAEATISFTSATNMRLDWTTNSGTGPFGGVKINYAIISGLTGAKVVNWQGPAGTGTKAVTGVGFLPESVFHLSNVSTAVPESNTRAFFGCGVMNATAQWANSFCSEDNSAVANSSRWQRTDSTILVVNMTEGTTLVRSAFSSMDADGFTTNFAVNGLGSSYQYASLCMAGATSKIGAFNKDTGAATDPQTVSSLGITPKGLLLSSVGATSSTSPATEMHWASGMSDGTNERCAAATDTDTADPSQADSVWSDAKVLIVPQASATTSSAADMTGFGSGQFGLDWTTNSGTAVEIVYYAVA